MIRQTDRIRTTKNPNCRYGSGFGVFSAAMPAVTYWTLWCSQVTGSSDVTSALVASAGRLFPVWLAGQDVQAIPGLCLKVMG
jgi:hypothetical protein